MGHYPLLFLEETNVDLVRKLMMEDCRASGLSTNTIKRAELEPLTKEQIEELTGHEGFYGYRIPYFNLQGERTDFYRIKLIEDPEVDTKIVKSSFGKAKKKASVPKYWQPSTLPQAYLPSKDLHPNPNRRNPLKSRKVITEGEKKTLKALQEGIDCIGLGGVWNFTSRKNWIDILSEFKKMELKNDEIEICFDSDFIRNDNVRKAIVELGNQLTRLGAKVFIRKLSDNSYDNNKIGLDDYLLEHDLHDYVELACEPFEPSQALWNLNEEIAVIKDPTCLAIIEEKDVILLRREDIKLIYENKRHLMEDNGKLKLISTLDQWLEWPYRREFNSLTYSPGKKQVINGNLNIWRGYAVEPKEGNIQPFFDLVNLLLEAENEEFLKWFWDWMAYPLQHPGTKLNTAVLFHSNLQGVGKSFLGEILGDIYGDNYMKIDENQLHGTFNGVMANKQLILAEEVTGIKRRSDADRIKGMITQEHITINEKYKPAYTVKDCANYIFTSNHPDALYLELNDRRFAVIEAHRKKSEDFYKKLDRWRKRQNGPAYLLHYLLNYEISKAFNPMSAAVNNKAKDDMIQAGMSDLQLFTQNLKNNPDAILQYGGVSINRDLFTTEDLYYIFDPKENYRFDLESKRRLSNALRKAGFKKERATKKSGDMKFDKELWMIRNKVTWIKATASERAINYLNNNVIDLEEQRRKRKKYRGGKE